MDKNLLTEFVHQLTLERQNAAIYDALSAGLDVVNWPGSSAFMHKSADEEREHAQKFCDFIVDRNESPVFEPLEAATFPAGNNLSDFFRAALVREQMTTESINALYFQAEEAEDPAACQFLHWFIAEQIKSERELTDILIMLERLGNDGKVVYDAQIGAMK